MRSVLLKTAVFLFVFVLSSCSAASTQVPETITTDIPAFPSNDISIESVDVPDAKSISLAGDANGVLYVLTGKDNSLYLSRSTDEGNTFSAPVLVTGDSHAHVLSVERPALATGSDNRVGVAWLELAADFQGGNIWYAASVDGGETFEPAVLAATEEAGEVAMVSVALDATGNPVLAWLNGSRLRFTRSSDGGKSFTEAVRLPGGSCECCQPHILLMEDNVFIAYRGLESGGTRGDIRDILLAYSNDTGETFNQPARVSDEHWYLPACPIAGPSLSFHEGNFYITWMDGRSEPEGSFNRGDVWFTVSTDDGKTFAPNIRVNSDQKSHHTLPTVAVGPGGRIHIAWESHMRDSNQIRLYYSTSDDGGQTFTEPQAIADSTDSTRGAPGKPVLFIDSKGRITLAWLDRLGARVASWMDTK